MEPFEGTRPETDRERSTVAKPTRPSRRAALLEFAILGLLHDGPLHGYELRKRLTTALGIFRALSYGSLYPALRGLVEAGHISEIQAAEATSALAGTRARITYELTAEGKERFQDLVHDAGPATWDDDDFDVRLAFFSRTEAQVRLRILEGRRSRLEERLAHMREAAQLRRERMDSYTLALQQHAEDRAEREVRWLEELIHAERHKPAAPSPAAYADPAPNPQNRQNKQNRQNRQNKE
jgi:DNA-binding PadR family transcriptional regulator